jgi:outer membrane protein W
MFTRATAVVGLVCLVLPGAVLAQGFTQGDKVFSLGGSGASDDEFIDNDFTFEGSLGYFFTDNLEVALRQGLTYNDVAGDDDQWAAATRVALDYNFDMGRIWPFVGVSLGYVYGDAVSDTWVAGPEVGVRYFVNNTTFILGMVEYEFFFDDADEAEDAFDDGRFVYTLSLGVRW